jgi:threonine dehydratase
LHAIFVPVGGGGLIAGIAAYVKRLRPLIKIIGVEPVDADAMYQSLRQGERITLSQVGLFADGVAVKRVGAETFRLCQQLVDEIILVDTDAICAAIKDVFEDTRSILEPAERPQRGWRQGVCGTGQAPRRHTRGCGFRSEYEFRSPAPCVRAG